MLFTFSVLIALASIASAMFFSKSKKNSALKEKKVKAEGLKKKIQSVKKSKS